LLCLAFSGSNLIGIGNDRWPENALATLDRQPLGARLFHEQDWGGLIESETQPTRLAYVDDRFELFGKEAILEYADALTGGPVWDTIRDRDQINLVWLKPDRGLAKRLTKDPAWTILHQDDKSILFTHAPIAPQTLAQQAKPSLQ
jgi:hypothetical protein